MTKRKPDPSPVTLNPSPSPTSDLRPPASRLVSLVGAGPGDPGLITVAGLDRIREADVIVYDRLVAPALLENAKPDAELTFVGKTPCEPQAAQPRSGAPSGLHGGEGPAAVSHDQPAINHLLIEKAREGKRVVRLKGGDPFVFGRGGEEAEALHAAGIPFEIVPGVTSAVAVPAYAGIPVTHRGLASSFAVITGHEVEELATRNSQLATPQADTLVFLMGTKTLPEIVENLIASGRPADTPAAVIRWGTTPEQQTVTGTLADIVSRVEEAGLTPPAITVVGEVVRLRDKLSWYENRPLFGKRVLITRTRNQASELARLLAAEGAIPIELPAIEIEPTVDPAAVDTAVSALARGEYDWAVFTSANAVDLWFDHLRDRHLDARAFGASTTRRGAATKVAAIGPATAAALAAHGLTADLVPTEYIAESLAQALVPVILSAETHAEQNNAPSRKPALSPPKGNLGAPHRGSTPAVRILLPRAENARPELVDALRETGAIVDELPLYRAAIPAVAQGPSPETEALNLLRDGAIDIVTFTSSSTVRNLAAILNGDIQSLRKPLIACIGPITASTAKEMLGRKADIVAEEYTVEGLVAALRDPNAGRL